MVEQLFVRTRSPDGSRVDGRRITKQIRDRCDKCYVADCWTLKNENDKGQIYVSKKLTTNGKPRKAQIRQFLFFVVYGEAPPVGRVIRMACGNNRCVNPGHMRVVGWRHPWDAISHLIETGWLTKEQAEKWFSAEAS